jgi:hypothetical protein
MQSSSYAVTRTCRVATHALAAMVLAVAAPTASLATDHQIGAVVQRDYRDATARPDLASMAHPIRFRDKVFQLDTVSTGPKGATSLQLLDETRLDLGPSAEVTLDAFIYDPESTVGAGDMSFAIGAFRYVGGRMTTEENVRLRTPTATMVIRGTELVIYVWPDGQTEVNVVSGAVEVAACGGAGGSQLATTGMRVSVTPDCATTVSSLRNLPAGLAALTLPGRFGDDDADDDDDRPGRDGRGNGGGRGGKEGKEGGNKGGAAGSTKG